MEAAGGSERPLSLYRSSPSTSLDPFGSFPSWNDCFGSLAAGSEVVFSSSLFPLLGRTRRTAIGVDHLIRGRRRQKRPSLARTDGASLMILLQGSKWQNNPDLRRFPDFLTRGLFRSRIGGLPFFPIYGYWSGLRPSRARFLTGLMVVIRY